MFIRKVDFRWLFAPQWCIFAVLLIGPTVAFCQGLPGATGGKPGNEATAEQRLYPNGLPKIEIMIKAALEHHPEVLAARSRLRAAEAEQRQAELKAVKDLMVVRDRWEKANRAASAHDPTQGPGIVRDALANLAAVEWELAFLLGTWGESLAGTKATAESIEAAESFPKTTGAVAADQISIEGVIPRGQPVARIRVKLLEKVDVNFDDLPLTDVAAFLSSKSGVRFILDKAALEGSGFPADTPITCQLGELELVTALQALEDLHQPLYFIVRDYGILMTTDDKRSSHTVSAIDFAKLNEHELEEKLRQQRLDETNMARRMGGMGGGGGMF